MRKAGSGVKIVPRVLLEGWTMADFQEVFATEPNMAQVAEFAVQNLKVGSHTVNIANILKCIYHLISAVTLAEIQI